MRDKIFLLGIGLNNFTKKEVLEYILENLLKKGKKSYIVTPNPEILVIANRDKSYKKVLNSANLALPDGVGIIWGAKFLGKRLKARITGVDLVENLCKEVAKRPITVGFLGSRAGIAVKTAECLRKNYPSLKVSFAIQEWPKSKHQARNSKEFLNSNLKNSKFPSDFGFRNSDLSCDILFVALGSPKQEFWIAKNLSKLPVRVAIGVGGAFDFISGRVPRAPKWIQRIGFEWLFRLIIQPWRIKRQLSLLKFIYLVFEEKFS